MSNSRPSTKVSKIPAASNKPFFIGASLVIVLSVGLAASAWPAALSYARTQSDRLSIEGQGSHGNEAELDFQLAHILNPNNQLAAVHFAQQQFDNKDYSSTVQTLGVAGESTTANVLRVQAYLELGQTDSAITAADQLVAGKSTSAHDLATAGLAYGVGKQPAKLAALTVRLKATVGSSEALQRVQRAMTYELALASELYTSGLLNSSSALLATLPDSVPRDLMLARIAEENKPDSWEKTASGYYRSAIKIDPTNITAYQGLIRMLDEQKDQSDATAARQQLKLLQTGQL